MLLRRECYFMLLCAPFPLCRRPFFEPSSFLCAGSAMDAWNAWVIRLTSFLQRQNGTTLDGILEWKRSVDKKFEGIESCAICLSIVDAKSAALPKERCKTCKNKFHSECLNRWFQQQVDPTCPLCREKFFTWCIHFLPPFFHTNRVKFSSPALRAVSFFICF